MQSIEQAVRTLLADQAELTAPVEQIDADQSLLDYGLNSILYVQLVVAIETHFGIEFDDTDLDIQKHPTIRSLVSYIQRYVSSTYEHME